MQKKSKHVLGIVGSPRRQGNTELLVDEVLAGAVENGALTNKVILNNLDIAPCRACEVCTKTGSCVHKDDMSDLLTQMFENDVWVLGTPVYWWGPTAQFKAFLDRWYGVNNRKLFEGKEVILVIPLGGASENAYGPTLNILTRVMRYLRLIHRTTILAAGVGRKGAIQNHPKLLASARKAGKDAALIDSSRY
jgi:multimeric flavodoxin WrbA